MAQYGVTQLTVNVYPNGQDVTNRRERIFGTLAINSPGTAISITAWSITSNVATFTAANSLTSGQVVTLSGFGTSTFFNGQAVTVLSTGLSGTQFEANFTHANGSATEAGSATLTPQYKTGGLALNWTAAAVNGTPAMIDGNYGVAPYTGTWGPLKTQPILARFYSVGGGLSSLPFYQYVYDTTNNTIRIASSSTELTANANITPDVIQFEAEFIKNAF